MSPRAFVPFIAAVLMAAFIFSMFPQTLASAGSAQQSTGSRPRRGKNGSRAPGTASKQKIDRSNPQPTQDARGDTDTGSSQQEDSQSTDSRNRQEDAFQQEDQSSTTKPQDADAQAQQSSERDRGQKEPAPFDRPPLGSPPSSKSSSQPATSNPPQQPSQPSRQDQADRQSQPQPRPEADNPGRQAPDLGGYDSGRADRTGKRPPVLQRPSGGRSREEIEPEPQTPDYPDANPGQSPSAGQGQVNGDEPIKLAATLVNIPVLVSDRSGRYVPRLSRQDFQLYEDGSLQEIAFFGDEEVPFKVALLLDVSPSVQGSLEDIQDAAIEFVRQLRPQDEVMVISFDKFIHFHTDFTNDRRRLEWAIRQTTTGSGTSVYDAVYETVRRRLNYVEGRKAMILFSDGEDTTSQQASYDDAIEIVTESDVLVYGLRYPGTGMNRNPWPTTRDPIPRLPIPFPFPWPWPGGRRRGPFTNLHPMNATGRAATASPQRPRWGRNGDFMQDITSAGGGPVYDAQQISDLRRLASRIAEELRHVYVVSYYPTNPLSNGGYRQIRIRVRGRDDIAVRHRKGYNARDFETRSGT